MKALDGNRGIIIIIIGSAALGGLWPPLEVS
jgi:hypothetical protein